METPSSKVLRKQVLAVFVSRIDSNTTNEEFVDYLSKAGLKDVVCRKLKPKDGKECKTAASTYRVVQTVATCSMTAPAGQKEVK